MKVQIALGVIVLMLMHCCLSSATAQVGQGATVNEARQVRFAEDVIMIELTHALSPSVRREREKCSFGCRGGWSALEIAIGLIGITRNDTSADALVNLLGLRLDAGGSEDRSCQILIRGRALLRHLERLQPKQIVEHCQSNFLRLRKRELSEVPDVNIEQVCYSEAEIRNNQDEFLKAIKSKVMCEE